MILLSCLSSQKFEQTALVLSIEGVVFSCYPIVLDMPPPPTRMIHAHTHDACPHTSALKCLDPIFIGL